MHLSIDSVRLNFSPDSLWVLNLCLAVIMFGISLDISVDDFRKVIESPKAAIIGLISQFLLLPALTFLVILVLQPAPSLALGMMMVAACPGGNISNFMTHMAKGNTALSVSLTSVGTVLSIFMTPLNLELWASLYAPTASILKAVSLDIWEVFKTIATLIGIPLILGMSFRQKFPRQAIALSKKVKPISILIFASFVVIAFANNFSIFTQYFQLIVIIVFLHNALALLLGYYSARVGGLPENDRKTLAIETGIQNSGLGLILIFGFFDGLGGMAIVAAWWGLWHIISGLSISYYWSQKKVTSEI
ncbi:MAG: bile acid:sodium symporter family protein [Cyclobacteriaceae bacterium]